MEIPSAQWKTLVESPSFNLLVTAAILFSTLLVGLSIEPSIDAPTHALIYFLEMLVLGFFCLEIVLRIGAEANQPLNFFKDAWNVFDFLIVVVCFLPLSTKFFFILRLARIFRTLRLFRAFPKLRVIIYGMINSFSSVLYVVLLLAMLVYVYAIIGVSMFAAADPAHFGGILPAAFTLFQVLTLESWNVIMVPVVEAFPIGGPLYFVSFIILGTMLIMNLFLGAIVINMSKAMRDLDEAVERSNEEKILEKIDTMNERLEQIKNEIQKK